MKEERCKYTKHINKWLNSSIISDISRYSHLLDETYSYCESNETYNTAIHTKISSYISDMYDNIKQVLKDCDLELSDENQFKEDFIYFMYKLSIYLTFKNAKKIHRCIF